MNLNCEVNKALLKASSLTGVVKLEKVKKYLRKYKNTKVGRRILIKRCNGLHLNYE